MTSLPTTAVRRGLSRYRGVGLCLLATLLIVAVFPPAGAPEEITAGSNGPGPAEIIGPGATDTDGADGTGDGVGPTGTTPAGAAGGTGGPSDTGTSTTGAAGLPANCDPATGRIRVPSLFAPPCVQQVADNGGATHQGITEDEILLVLYLPQPDPALDAILQSLGVADTAEQVIDTWLGFVDMFETHYETYGRNIRLEIKEGSGDSTDAVAARADAVDVATRIKPFAVFASLAPREFNEELAQRGVVVFNLLQFPQSWWADHDPYIYGTQLSCTQVALVFGEYIAKRVAAQNAIHAGDESFHDKARKFGLVLVDDEEGTKRQCADTLEAELARHGVVLGDRITYEFDAARLAEQARVIMARMQDKGVTSVLFMADFVSGLIFPRAATNLEYFPEWIIPGGNLLDTIYVGRLYDPQQWENAFGLSQLWLRPPLEQNEVYFQYVWHHGEPPPARVTFEILYQELWLLFTGVHMAGPNLTPQTFQAGLFNFPTAGAGAVTQVQRSFGPGGPWPFTSYTAFDNVAEVWWDPGAAGPDETGQQGKGMWRWIDGGRRYSYGDFPSTPSRAFDPAGAPTHLDSLPESDRFPEYPPPR